MDITAFVRELLLSHDCVIVPGFGGFIGNYTPARIDKSTSTFFPPVKQISFNRNLNHNDGLLVGKVSGYTKVNYGDARNIVEEFVTSVRKKLERGEKIVFDNIGSFSNNQEGNVQFEPDHNVNYHLDSYGLESFQFAPIEEYDVRKRLIKHLDKDAVKRTPMRRILIRAAVLVPLLAIMAIIPFKTDLFKSKVETTNLNPLATAEFENNKKAVDEKIAAEPVNTNNIIIQPAIPAPEATTAESYCLITGSFKLFENAEKQAAQLRKEGYDPEIINAPNGFFRVSAIKVSGLEAAASKKDSISSKYRDAWIKKI
jgi:nucleoid DNA-binding protein